MHGNVGHLRDLRPHTSFYITFYLCRSEHISVGRLVDKRVDLRNLEAGQIRFSVGIKCRIY